MHTRRETFFTCWACKEAFIKALGTGLSFPLDQFDVVSTTNKPEVLLSIEKEPEEAARWSLRTLPADPGYTAALAVKGHSFRLWYWQWRSYEKSAERV